MGPWELQCPHSREEYHLLYDSFEQRGSITTNLHHLPTEVVEHIFSYLAPVDLQATKLVCRQWRIISKNANLYLYTQFIIFLMKNIDSEKYSIQKQDLVEIQIVDNVYELNEALANTLKDLEKEELNELERLSLAHYTLSYFKNIFKLTKIYKKLEEVEKIRFECEFLKQKKYFSLSKKLIEIDYLDKALEVVLKTSDVENTNIFADISKRFADKNDLDKSLQVANLILVKNPVIYYSEVQTSEQAYEDYISTYLSAIDYIICLYLKQEKFDEAIDIGYIVAYDLENSLPIEKLVIQLIKKGRLDKALKATEIMLEEPIFEEEDYNIYKYNNILSKICLTLKSLDLHEDSCTVANKITDDVMKFLMLNNNLTHPDEAW